MPRLATAMAMMLMTTTAAMSQEPERTLKIVPFDVLSCYTIVGNGWAKMPDVADYINAIPGSEKLGFGSECHLGSLVFAQCFLEPR